MKKLFVSILLLFLVLEGGFLLISKFKSGREVKLYCRESEAGIYEELVSLYKTEEPKGNIRLVIIPDSKYNISDIMNNKKADMLTVKESEYSLLDESKLLSADSVNGADRIIKGIADGSKALPLGGRIPVIFYNMQLMENTGVSPASSTEQLGGVCRALGADGTEAIAYKKAGDIFDLTEISDTAATTGLGRDELEYIRSLTGSYAAEAKIVDDSELISHFLKGNTAMIAGYSDMREKLQGAGFDIEMKIMFGSGMEYTASWRDGMALAIKKSGKNKNLMRFTEFLVSPSAQQLIYDKTPYIPVSGGVKAEGYKQELYDFISLNNEVMRSVFSGMSDEEHKAFISEQSMEPEIEESEEVYDEHDKGVEQ